MEAIAEQVKELGRGTDELGRRKLASALRDLSYSLESPRDTTLRIISYHGRISAVRTAIDLKIFDKLAASDKPNDIESLAREIGTDPSLIARYLRYLASFGMVIETAKDTFSANNVTEALADPGKQASVIHYFDTVGPSYQALPTFLRATNFVNPEDVMHCAFQVAYNTSKSAFDYFPELPLENLVAFNKYMSTRSADMATWLSVYPFGEETADCKPEDVVFVDVGGGIGHQCQALRAKYPDLKGRVIVQDLEHSIRGKEEFEGVEGMGHNFFDEQPVKGARFYYLRTVLHDWPDESCHTILTNLKDAMNERSLILIDEMVLPNVGVHWSATHTDLTMMASLAAKERTHEQWESLLNGAGLKIATVRKYKGGWAGYEGLITVEKKD